VTRQTERTEEDGVTAGECDVANLGPRGALRTINKWVSVRALQSDRPNTCALLTFCWFVCDTHRVTSDEPMFFVANVTPLADINVSWNCDEAVA